MYRASSSATVTPESGLLSGSGLLEQAAEYDLSLLLGLHGLPEPQPAAGQRIGARKHLDEE